jgi:tryptophan 7-halogenase
VPDSLLERIELWKYAAPTQYDFSSRMEIFNLENYLYVLYGMHFPTDLQLSRYRYLDVNQARRLIELNHRKAEQAISELMPHRQLIKRIQQFGLQTF